MDYMEARLRHLLSKYLQNQHILDDNIDNIRVGGEGGMIAVDRWAYYLLLQFTYYYSESQLATIVMS